MHAAVPCSAISELARPAGAVHIRPGLEITVSSTRPEMALGSTILKIQASALGRCRQGLQEWALFMHLPLESYAAELDERRAAARHSGHRRSLRRCAAASAAEREMSAMPANSCTSERLSGLIGRDRCDRQVICKN